MKVKAVQGSKERIQMIQGSSFTELDLQVPAVEKVVAPHGEGHFLKDMENLDPKAVFANERTLLHYAEKGMYVAAVAVVAMNHNSRDIKIFGLVLSALTAAYYLWILVAYFQRLSEITGRSKVVKNREARLDWEAGPWLAAGMVLVVLVYTLSKARKGPFCVASCIFWPERPGREPPRTTTSKRLRRGFRCRHGRRMGTLS
ncbi:VTC4 [Symbiodinium necroappetens]|uniref:VTC4 protein n=1 Tax=Symbiodinium necroappetens TaxID=1628268 RepID=A0A812VYP8_9DINO|nr:VTC4 [Symbiodinium necroappetens]